jgi:TnpA family transposase
MADTKLYPKKDASYDALKPMIGAPLVIKHIRAHWDDILRRHPSSKVP